MKKYVALGLALCFIPALSACRTHPDQPSPPLSATEESPAAPLPDIPQEPAEEDAAAEYILVLADGLNVRSGAGTDFPVTGRAERGALLGYAGAERGWYRTVYRDRTAYVSADARYTALFSLETGQDETEAVVGEGLRLLGTPYVYGAVRFHDGNGHRLRGFTADEFDCSSLMQYIFYRGAGVLLDVTTRTQIKQGAHVEKTDLRRGDLMFFTNAARQNKTGLERVGHVALYLGGDYILHTASDYAKIETLSQQRRDYFLEARRVL